MRKVRTWVVMSAVSPIVFPLVAVGVAYVVDAITGTGADIAWNWLFVLILGIVLFLPGICATLVGAALLPRRSGAVITFIGLLLSSAAAALLITGGLDDARNSLDGQPRMTPRLSISEAFVFAVPYALVILVSLYAAWRVIAAARTRDETTGPITPQDHATPASSG
ncbi:hypothetical protein [Nocardia sp. NPDC058705]|uniref:hypothetical protein n=1 Tax=Nocardia sp. NPDC058705 TaxID=3346609 RepID=UPI0036C3E92B